MNPTHEGVQPRPLTREGPGPVPARVTPHETEARLVIRKPPVSERLARGIQAHPGRALLVAACTGFALGRLIRFAFRSVRRS